MLQIIDIGSRAWFTDMLQEAISVPLRGARSRPHPERRNAVEKSASTDLRVGAPSPIRMRERI
jgi:hypothetical protein